MPWGTGTARLIKVFSSNSTWGSLASYGIQTGSAPFFNCIVSTARSTTWIWSELMNWTSSASSSTVTFISVSPTVSQTSTAGYTWLLVNVTESTTWSWAKNLQLWQIWWTTKAWIDNNWWLLNARVISANAATPVNITAPESNKVYTNEWASAKVVFNLPTAVAGYTYTFMVQDADWIDVTAAAWDTIRRNTNVTAAAWTVTSTTIGSMLTLVAINATEWVAINEIWTWA